MPERIDYHAMNDHDLLVMNTVQGNSYHVNDYIWRYVGGISLARTFKVDSCP